MERQLTNELTYTGSDGWPLYAHAMDDGPLLVMLHGGGPGSGQHATLAERLTDRYRVASAIYVPRT